MACLSVCHIFHFFYVYLFNLYVLLIFITRANKIILTSWGFLKVKHLSLTFCWKKIYFLRVSWTICGKCHLYYCLQYTNVQYILIDKVRVKLCQACLCFFLHFFFSSPGQCPPLLLLMGTMWRCSIISVALIILKNLLF